MASQSAQDDAISSELFARIKRIQIRTRHLVNDVLAAYINIAISQATASMPGGVAMPSTPSAPHFP